MVPKAFCTRNRPPVTSQRGLAMIMIIVLLTLISAYLITSGINRTSTEVSIEREQGSQDALQQAKTALIAYAASQAWGTDQNDQPGSLPCPDTTLNNGVAYSCSTSATSRVGRLPWKTIGAPELRDASGEKLWYALSANFRTASGTTLVNSDTLGQLTVVGAAPASNVVAVLIAPGPAVLDTVLLNQPQDRRAANVNRVASYLEDRNAAGTDTFTTAAPGANGVYNAAASTFNSISEAASFFSDRVLSVTHADLFSTVEPAVAARIERDIKPYIAAYFQQWGAFPFPAKFHDTTVYAPATTPATGPGTSSTASSTRPQTRYVGDTTQTSGLLPVVATATYPLNAGTGSVTLTGGTAGSISGVSCTTITTPTSGFYCTFTLNAINLGSNSANWGACTDSSNVKWRYCMANPIFRAVGNIANVGTSFADMADSDVTVTGSSGTTTRPMSSTVLARTLSSAGVATVTFDGTYSYSRYSSSSFTRSMRITFPVVSSGLVSSGDPNAGWFIRNQWYRQVYYAVSPGHLPGGCQGCSPQTGSLPAACVTPGPTPSCLSVNNMAANYSSPSTNKRAILILAGRSINGTSRPSSSLADYLEGENSTPSDYIFEHRAGSPSSINDRVIVISP